MSVSPDDLADLAGSLAAVLHAGSPHPDHADIIRRRKDAAAS